MSCVGCSDSSQVPVSFTLPDCPEGSNCEEYSMLECVHYTGPNLPSLEVTNEMGLKDILVKINKKLTNTMVAKTYTITVTTSQSTTVVEYINNLGNLVSKSVSSAQSPQTICAQEGSPVKISGSGTLSAAGSLCYETTT
jgi:hypothetical protein